MEEARVLRIKKSFDKNFENYTSNLPVDFSMPQDKDLEYAMEKYLLQV